MNTRDLTHYGLDDLEQLEEMEQREDGKKHPFLTLLKVLGIVALPFVMVGLMFYFR